MIPETPGYTRARRLLSLSSVVRDALPMMRAAVANTAALRIAVDEHAPPVEANPVAMHRVLMKLVQNASQAIRQPDGVIEIGVAGMTSSDYPSHPFVRLTVGDNGIGMGSAALDNLRRRLLEPADSYGAGLGLRIVHRAIRAHGGRLQIDSHPGLGTTVRIDLPAAPPRAGVHDSGACEGEDPNSTGHQSNG
jgi:signal transduction histidine kinase